PFPLRPEPSRLCMRTARRPENASVNETRSAMDVAAVRRGFPGLWRTRDGTPVVFADAPGGTQVPARVIEAMAAYLRERNANTGGAFDTSRETDQLIQDARRAAADFLGAD